MTEETAKRYAEAVQTKAPAEIEQYQIHYRTPCINQRDRCIINELQPLQQNYNAADMVDCQTGLEGISVYQEIYPSLVSVELERFLENLRKAQVRRKERFRTEQTGLYRVGPVCIRRAGPDQTHRSPHV